MRRISSLHPMLILPRSWVNPRARLREEGLLGQWAWCAVCDLPVDTYEKCDAGNGRTVWRAWCHGERGTPIKSWPSDVIEIRRDSESVSEERLDEKAQRLVFFKTDAQLGGERDHFYK